MGVFQENLCDCCVCPMQCALKQFEGESILVVTTIDLIGGVALPVDNVSVQDFNLTGMNGDNFICFPINQILFFTTQTPRPITLKPNKQNAKGNCACIENAATNKFNVNELVNMSGLITGIVTNVGEGVVVINDSFIASTCNSVFWIITSSSSSSQMPVVQELNTILPQNNT
ncbi:hypothetical protein [Chengkuizengella axinellae]|uniref:Uncharacterized protein n=1 Tax=Chengkuizengella axinellae TaxID=3064388 RepID=A0ABT9J1S6_9BACL|nr:hypothetical protein [Chengkuizengella sp. 2205SS18-9]MDP5275566.1 hypothetical protein [Chengkuizengella sp. 2205SS18-9]